MALAKKKCRVCGKLYEPCRDARSVKSDLGVFVWQNVTCSPACGAIYFSQINASRAPAVPADITATEPAVAKQQKSRRGATDGSVTEAAAEMSPDKEPRGDSDMMSEEASCYDES